MSVAAPPAITKPTESISFEADLRTRRQRRIEFVIESLLFISASLSVLITIGIVGMLLRESIPFFKEVSLKQFLGDTQWTPNFADKHFGIWPLVCGTFVTTVVALFVAVPVGLISAIWLSEYAPGQLREIIKPILELLAAVPTVVYGYFALLIVTPILQTMLRAVGIELPTFNMLSAGVVMGIMIMPYIASLSEDAMRAVPLAMREGSYAMGATRMQTATRVIVPSALSGLTAAFILGVARAIGETMIVAIAAGGQPTFTLNPSKEAFTITSYIVAISKGDTPHGTLEYRTIFAAGLVLMLMTLVFNIAGYVIRKRYRQAY